jgi:outer membrane protein assembly factor BamB
MKRARRLAVLVAFTAAISLVFHAPWASAVAAPRAPAALTNWPQFGFVPAHTLSNPFESILGPSNVGQLQVDWSGPFDFNPICCSSPVVVNGVVYVGTGDNHLRAYRALTGDVLWSANVGGGQVSTAAVSNGVVYLGSGDWNVYAFDARTGVQLWAHKTGGPVVAAPTVAGGLVFVGSDDGNTYALDPATGNVVWTQHIGGEVNSPPAADHGLVFVGNFTGSFELTALDSATGTVAWTAPLDGYIDMSSVAVARRVVYAVGVAGAVYAFDEATGNRRWSVTLPNVTESSPAVAGRLVYVGCYDHNVYALDARTGATRWTATTGNLVAGAAAVANGVVYVGSTDNHEYGFDALTGATLWDATMTGPVQFSSPAIVDGRVYVAADKLYAFALP